MAPPISYVLPILARCPVPDELLAYLDALVRIESVAEVIVVDRSDREVFEDFEARCCPGVRHVPVDAALESLANGKVAGVLTGVRLASREYLILADEDVRYDEAALLGVLECLEQADLVAPQNYFDPLPWHAWLDSARSLINRATGGDWPGTFGVRRAALLRTSGYDGNVLFENLELVRTLEAAGSRVVRPLGLFVRRLPPTADHFWSQRIRQAYDELARPGRLIFWLALLPAGLTLTASFGVRALGVAAGLSTIVAAFGRTVGAGHRVFPLTAVFAAPLWLLERAICAWLAVAARIFLGGIPYAGRILSRAATPSRVLRRRHASIRRMHVGRTPVALAVGESDESRASRW